MYLDHRITVKIARILDMVDMSALLLDERKILNLPRCLLAMVLVCLGVWIVNRPAGRPDES